MTQDFRFQDDILKSHIAVLGMTGSGKSSTEKVIIEQVVAGGARVCVLDPIKSDWWGITSSADGRRPGLPFQILGGPKGHVKLSETAGGAVGELVATGALPLSIIDMADFPIGGPNRFFVDFADSLFRKIKGVVYLVIEETHEFAPKERSGFGKENMALHWAKKLATGSRSKGLRLVVATQRVQQLHNALLGSCSTMIVHRMTLDADQDPVRMWLKGNAPKDITRQVEDSFSSLADGQGWICNSRAKVFQKVQFPRIKTFDNTATPEDDDEDIRVTTAPVDIERLRTILGDAVRMAEENDLDALKAANAELRAKNAELRSAQSTRPGAADQSAIREVQSAAFERGFNDGYLSGWRDGWPAGYSTAVIDESASIARKLAEVGDAYQGRDRYGVDVPETPAPVRVPTNYRPPSTAPMAIHTYPIPAKTPRETASPKATGEKSGLSPTARKIVDAIHAAFPVSLSYAAAAMRAGASKRSSAYSRYEAEIGQCPEIEMQNGRFRSAPGFQKVSPPVPGQSIVKMWAARLPPSYGAMLMALNSSPGPMHRDAIAKHASVSPTSSGLSAGLRELCDLEIAVKLDDGRYQLSPDLR